MTNINKEKVKRSIEEFIRKSILVILNSRIHQDDSTSSRQKINTSFGLDESEINELEDVFLEDYSNLQSSTNNYTNYILEIFYKRKDLNLLIEKYSFNYYHDEDDCATEAYQNKKLKTMLRSIYTISRTLPGYSYYAKNDNSYSLEYRLFSNLKAQKSFEKKGKTSKLKLANAELSNLTIAIEYLSQSEIKRIEDEHSQTEFEKIILNHHKERPRCFSLTQNQNVFQVLNFGDNSTNIINENYFSDKHTKTNYNNFYSTNQNLSQIKPNANFDLSFQSDIDNNNYSFETYSHLEIELNEDFIKTMNCANNSSSFKKIMKTSDTTSSFSSDNSFELEIENENDEKEHFEPRKESKNYESNETVANIENSNIEIENIIKKMREMKKIKKAKKTNTKINLYHLSEVYSFVINH